MAEDFGARVTVDPESEDLLEVVAEHTDGLGVDVAVICIGLPALVNKPRCQVIVPCQGAVARVRLVDRSAIHDKTPASPGSRREAK